VEGWQAFRRLSDGRVVQARPVEGGWKIKVGLFVARRVNTDVFERDYEKK
jgi:hypothetical protein